MPIEALTDVHKEPNANTLTDVLCVQVKAWTNSPEKINVAWFGGEALAWEVTRRQNLARPVCVFVHWGEVGMLGVCEQGLYGLSDWNGNLGISGSWGHGKRAVLLNTVC